MLLFLLLFTLRLEKLIFLVILKCSYSHIYHVLNQCIDCAYIRPFLTKNASQFVYPALILLLSFRTSYFLSYFATISVVKIIISIELSRYVIEQQGICEAISKL